MSADEDASVRAVVFSLVVMFRQRPLPGHQAHSPCCVQASQEVEVEAELTLHRANVGLENTKKNRQFSSTTNSIRRILILMIMLVLPRSIQIEQLNASKISVHPHWMFAYLYVSVAAFFPGGDWSSM
jgi:hypothetical protein